MYQMREVTNGDEDFLYQLFASWKVEEFSGLPLPDHQLLMLLKMQYEAQKQSYQQQFPQAKHELIHINGQSVGRMITDVQEQYIHLVDILLLKEFQGKGYGTSIIKELQENAKKKNRFITLHVFQGNPAQQLYEKCGFVIVGEKLPYIKMQWNY